MKELRLNIWGKTECERPDGGLCTACCVLPNIELEGTYVSLAKPANSPCSNLDKGCTLHQKGKPDTCKTWHCSMADLNGKIDLIAQGLSLGEVNDKEAVTAASELLNENGVTHDEIDDSIKAKVILRSVELYEITQKRALILRDLNEP